MVRSAAWRAALERYRWLDRYLAGDTFARYVDAEEARVRAVLAELRTQEQQGSGSGVYPLFVLTGLASFAIAAVAIGRRTRDTHSAPPLRWRPLGLVAIAAVAYLMLAESAGFIIAAAILFWLTARAFDSRRPLRDALFAIALSTAAYILFARVLGLTLPPGLFHL